MGLDAGTLTVQFNAESGELQNDLSEVNRQLDQTGERAESGASRASGAFLVLGSALRALTPVVEATGTVGRVLGNRFLRLAGFAPLLAAGFTAIGAALTGIAISRLAGDGLALAASFEDIAVSLETLTGSAEAARKVLTDVDRIVLATPFGLQELSDTARQLAVVFGEDTDAISEFTAIAADIAAVSGRGLEQIAPNIQRALTSGLGSAEILRESGISQLLLEVSGQTDVAALSGEALLQAFRDLTSEGGRACGAAEARARTLSGALSNATIAAQTTSRTFGELLAPDAVSRAFATQRAFGNLTESVRDFGPAIQASSALFTLFRNLLVSLGAAAVQVASTAFAIFGAGLQGVQTAIFAAGTAIQELVETFGSVALAAGQLATGNLSGAIATIKSIDLTDSAPFQALANVFNTQLVPAARNAERSFFGFLNSLIDVTGDTFEFRFALDEATSATQRNTAANEANAASLLDRSEAQQKVAENLRQSLAVLNRVEGIQAEIDALDEEIRRVGALEAAEVDRATQAEVLNGLARERIELARTLAQAEENLPEILAAVNEQIAALGTVDPTAARDFAVQLSDALTSAGADATEQLRAAANVAQAIRDRAEQAELDRIARIEEEEIDALRRVEGERLSAARELDQIRAAVDLRALEGADRRIEELNREIAAAERLGEIAGRRVTAELITSRLIEERAKVLEEQAELAEAQFRAQQTLPATLEAVNAQIAELARFDSAEATAFALDLQDALVAAGDDPRAAVAAVARISQEIRETLPLVVEESMGEGLARAFGNSLLDLAGGRSADFAANIGGLLRDRAQEGLDEAFESAVDGLGALLDSALSGAADAFGALFSGLTAPGGPLGGLGESLGGLFGEGAGELFGDAALAVVGAGLQAFGREDRVRSEAGRVRSAADSVERVRGIVAGPTGIAIAQVAPAIADSFIGTNQILLRIEENTARAARAATGASTGSVPSGGSSAATSALGSEGPALF